LRLSVSPSYLGIMLSHTLAWLLVTFTTLVVVTPTPPNNTIGTRQNDVWVGCSKQEEIQIYAAFKKIDKIVGSDSVWNINWNNPAAVDYFGYVALSYKQLASTIC
jgi:hypothetical protein